jgi:hypothetical protein
VVYDPRDSPSIGLYWLVVVVVAIYTSVRICLGRVHVDDSDSSGTLCVKNEDDDTMFSDLYMYPEGGRGEGRRS